MPIDDRIRSLIQFEPLVLDQEKSGIHAGWLRLPKLPIERDLRHLLIETVELIHEAAEKFVERKIAQDIYLQMTQLERPSGPQIISRNGSRWKPLFGLGIWPDREPPQPINEDDFKNLSPGQSPRETTYQLLHICASEEFVRKEVIGQVAGSGALLLVLADEEWGQVQRDAISERLEASMTAEAFMGYPFYFPLLDAKSLESLHRSDIDAIFPEVTVYIREDLSKNAIFFLSRIPLDSLFSPVVEVTQ
jgi:hypothetical protein